MQVFISWSGETSKLLAEALTSWLPQVLQSVRTYFSPDDIEKGTRWETEIARNLEASEIGLLCVTRDNTDAPWLLYEAGALSKNLSKSRVVPILFGLEISDLVGPLASLNGTPFNQVEMKKTVQMVNAQLGDEKLETSVVDSAFNKWWSDLKDEAERALAQAKTPPPPKRAMEDMVEEILQLTRAMRISRVPLDKNSTAAVQSLITEYTELALAAGGAGYTMKDARRNAILTAAKHLLSGPSLPLPPAVKNDLFKKLHVTMQTLEKKAAPATSAPAFENEDDDLPF